MNVPQGWSKQSANFHLVLMIRISVAWCSGRVCRAWRMAACHVGTGPTSLLVCETSRWVFAGRFQVCWSSPATRSVTTWFCVVHSASIRTISSSLTAPTTAVSSLTILPPSLAYVSVPSFSLNLILVYLHRAELGYTCMHHHRRVRLLAAWQNARKRT